MQFRTRTAKNGSQSWGVIRWRYDASKGRGLPSTIGTLTDMQLRRACQPGELLLADQLTGEEQDQLKEFWKCTRPALMVQLYDSALAHALFDVERVVEAIEAGAATPQSARKLWERIDQVASALRRARLPRPQVR